MLKEKVPYSCSITPWIDWHAARMTALAAAALLASPPLHVGLCSHGLPHHSEQGSGCDFSQSHLSTVKPTEPLPGAARRSPTSHLRVGFCHNCSFVLKGRCSVSGSQLTSPGDKRET